VRDKSIKSLKPVWSNVGDMRAILFWAGVGVSQSKAGSYDGIIEGLIEKYRKEIGMRPSEFVRKPLFKGTLEKLIFKEMQIAKKAKSK
jgi:hypothetical protein